MARIAFLGLGAMGARMAKRLIAAGHDVTVWNRTPKRAKALSEVGATVASTPASAVTGCTIALSMVRDDDAARAVWLGPNGALAGLERNAVGVECSTLSLPGIQHLAAAFATAERTFVDAPLAGSRPQAEAGSLIFLVGGAEAVIKQLAPVLLTMGGALHHAGPTGAGCLAKLFVNAMFGAQLALAGEFIGLFRRAGIDPAPLIEAYAGTPVASPAMKAAAPSMLGDSFPPAFPIDLVAKDFLMIDRTASALDAAVPLAAATGQIFAAACGEGLGEQNATGIVRKYVA